MKLLAAFPPQGDVGMNAGLRAAAYVTALDGKPAWAIAAAREAILRGETVLDTRFAPTPPQLAMLVWSMCEPVRRDIRDLEDIQTAAGAHDPKKVDEPAERAAFADRIVAEAGLVRTVDDEDKKRRAAVNVALEKVNKSLFELACREAGVDPAGGVSPALLRSLGQLPQPGAKRQPVDHAKRDA